MRHNISASSPREKSATGGSHANDPRSNDTLDLESSVEDQPDLYPFREEHSDLRYRELIQFRTITSPIFNSR